MDSPNNEEIIPDKELKIFVEKYEDALVVVKEQIISEILIKIAGPLKRKMDILEQKITSFSTSFLSLKTHVDNLQVESQSQKEIEQLKKEVKKIMDFLEYVRSWNHE